MRWPILLVLYACTGCTPSTPIHVEMVVQDVPVVEGWCPLPAPAPLYPPRIVSVEALRLFAQEADAARIHDRAALRECTMRLHHAVSVLDALRAGQVIP
jgi:hypothetical protein